MSIVTKIFDDPQTVAVGFANDFARWVNESTGTVSVALSGGSTPKLLFEFWASDEAPAVDWSQVHFFWGDERCVPPDHADSNYGVAHSLFLEPAGIGRGNIHQILGEQPPATERIRYGKELLDCVSIKNETPQFDVLILGMGNDGHTASIFPDQMELLKSKNVCEVAKHPITGQLRITLTGKVIANAKRIAFLITGESKSEKVTAIMDNKAESEFWPATQFFKLPSATVYLDRAAAGSQCSNE